MPYEFSPEELDEIASWSDEEAADVLLGVWLGATRATEGSDFPSTASLIWFLGRLTYAEVCEAIEITVDSLPCAHGDRLVRYFYGVCHGMIRQRRGGK